MTQPHKNPTAIQKPSDALTAWLALCTDATVSAMRVQSDINACLMGMMADNMNLMRCSFDPQRCEDRKKKANPCAAGPDLTDHYGRRHHDVDVERAL